MKRFPSSCKFTAIIALTSTLNVVNAFVAESSLTTSAALQRQLTCSTSTSLNAIGVLARKAKEAEVRKYCEDGVDDDVLAIYKEMKEKVESVDLSNSKPGPLQEALTKRKGTITIIAEYKRKLEKESQTEADESNKISGYINEIFDPEILSPTFREFGASAIAVLADERMGGCTYDDIKAFVKEQDMARREVPGPLLVINDDLIVDEIQIARSKSAGAAAIVLQLNALGKDKVIELSKYAKALDLEVIVAVSTTEEANMAVSSEVGCTILSVINLEGSSAKEEILKGLEAPSESTICTIANILTRNNQAFEEIEEAWECRDKGFNSVWVSDALYKGGADALEHPGAIINSMKAKSSVKWASPKARSGKGEGAREYLGDILM